MTDALIAEVEREIEELVPLFMSTRRDNLAGLDAGMVKQDFRAIESIGHSMKGAGGAYGFYPVTEIGGLIERAALRGDREQIAALIERLRVYLANVQIRYV